MGIGNLPERIYSYIRELGSLTPLAFLTTFLPIPGGLILLAFAVPLGNWLRGNWEIGMPLYLLGVIVFCGLAVITTNIIGMVGGWAFGFSLGIAVLIIGVTGAAVVSYFIYSRMVGDRLPQVFEKHPKAQAVYEALVGESFRRATLIIFLVRMSPAMPFALTNFLMASARVPLKAYVIGTFFGMLPRSSAVVFVGAGLSELNFENVESSWMLIFGIVVTIISVIVIGNISRRALERLTDKNAPA